MSDFTKKQYPEAIEEWNFSSEKFGWSFRLKDKKRVLIYLLPRDQYFKVAFVFGDKATDAILESTIAESIKSDIKAAKNTQKVEALELKSKTKCLLLI